MDTTETTVRTEAYSAQHRRVCFELYARLKRPQPDAASYVREFFETMRCDDVHNLSYRRTEWRMRTQLDDTTRLARVLGGGDTETDRVIVTNVMGFLRQRDQRALSAALPGCADIKCLVS
jgi:hypothetical protein